MEMYNLKQLYYFLCLHTTTLTSCQLDRRQFYSVLSDLKQYKTLWRPMFDAIDTKNDNVIDFEEFLAFVKVLKRGEEAERRQLCFQLLDFDHDGFTDKNDVQFVERCFRNLKPRNPSSASSLPEEDRKEKYAKLCEHVGEEKDGRFTRSDFEAYCLGHGEVVVNETLSLIEHMFDIAIDETGILITQDTVVTSRPHMDWQDHNTRMHSWFCCTSQTPVFTKAPQM